MAIKVRKKQNESIDSLLRRFRKHLNNSEILQEFKEKMYRKKRLTKRLRKASALRRLEIVGKRRYLVQTGRPEAKVKKER